MKVAIRLLLLIGAVLLAQAAPREAFYSRATSFGGQIVPLFANGYLVYLHQEKRLQVFRPDTELAYDYDVPCPPQTSHCGLEAVAVSREGVVALGIGFLTKNGYASGIRLIDAKGEEIRFISTGRYGSRQLAFDKHGAIWSIGWQRDEWANDRQSRDDYNIARKYSPQGKLEGEFLPKSLWTAKLGPSLGGRGYWTMYAADDRIGAIFNENMMGATPEWVEWDLNGNVLRRVLLPKSYSSLPRAFTRNGTLYAQFPAAGEGNEMELKSLEPQSGEWIPVRSNLPSHLKGFLLGADGDDLVYREIRDGIVRLVWAKPE